jgi:hypothetical protein
MSEGKCTKCTQNENGETYYKEPGMLPKKLSTKFEHEGKQVSGTALQSLQTLFAMGQGSSPKVEITGADGKPVQFDNIGQMNQAVENNPHKFEYSVSKDQIAHTLDAQTRGSSLYNTDANLAKIPVRGMDAKTIADSFVAPETLTSGLVDGKFSGNINDVNSEVISLIKEFSGATGPNSLNGNESGTFVNIHYTPNSENNPRVISCQKALTSDGLYIRTELLTYDGNGKMIKREKVKVDTATATPTDTDSFIQSLEELESLDNQGDVMRQSLLMADQVYPNGSIANFAHKNYFELPDSVENSGLTFNSMELKQQFIESLIDPSMSNVEALNNMEIIAPEDKEAKLNEARGEAENNPGTFKTTVLKTGENTYEFNVFYKDTTGEMTTKTFEITGDITEGEVKFDQVMSELKKNEYNVDVVEKITPEFIDDKITELKTDSSAQEIEVIDYAEGLIRMRENPYTDVIKSSREGDPTVVFAADENGMVSQYLLLSKVEGEIVIMDKRVVEPPTTLGELEKNLNNDSFSEREVVKSASEQLEQMKKDGCISLTPFTNFESTNQENFTNYKFNIKIVTVIFFIVIAYLILSNTIKK